MDKVRIGIIGIGNMGSGHADKLLAGEVPELELTAVADIRECRRKWAEDKLPSGIRIFDNASEMMRSELCDAVLVAVPHYAHPPIVIEALKNNLHVLCEKPAGVYTSQVREMNRVAGESDRVFAIMLNQRTNHIYRKMHELVKSNKFGQIKRVNWIITDWYRTQAYYNSGGWRATWDGEGGGVLLNQCPHNLDLLQWICGLPVKVRAFCHYGKWHDIEVEDDVTAYFEFENGATGVFVTSTGDAPGTNRFEIDLEKGKLVCENGELSVYQLEVSEREFCYTADGGFDQPAGKYIEVETDGENPQHVGVMKAFANRILNGAQLIAEGKEGLNGLLLSNAMYLSDWLGKEIEIPFDEELFLTLLNEKRKTSVKKTVEEKTFSTEGTY